MNAKVIKDRMIKMRVNLDDEVLSKGVYALREFFEEGVLILQ